MRDVWLGTESPMTACIASLQLVSILRTAKRCLSHKMVVLDEKQAQIVPGNAPPPYPGLPSAPPPGGDGAKVGAANYEIDTDSTLPAFPNAPLAPATFSILPSNILLYIVHLTLPENNWSTKWKIARTQESLVERKRKVLYWMMICLRCVNRALYVRE